MIEYNRVGRIVEIQSYNREGTTYNIAVDNRIFLRNFHDCR